MNRLKEKFDNLKPLLDEFIQRKNKILDDIIHNGKIPSEICAKCRYRRIMSVTKFDSKTLMAIHDFLSWLNENQVTEIQCNTKKVFIVSWKKKIGTLRGKIFIPPLGVVREVGIKKRPKKFEYTIPISTFKNNSFANLFNHEFFQLRFCLHVQDSKLMEESTPIILKRYRRVGHSLDGSPTLWDFTEMDGDSDSVELKFLCEDCYNRIENLGCIDRVTRHGFGYHIRGCQYDTMLFQNLLKTNEIEYRSAAFEHLKDRFGFYLSTLDILAVNELKGLPESVAQLKPEIILLFGKSQDIVDCLGFDCNIIIVDDVIDAPQHYYLFNKDKKMEESVEKIVSHLVSNLYKYADQIRGKEHDRLIGAFEKIGQDLGYVPKREVTEKGTRVDLIWYDRQGSSRVSIEVETSGTWKKDLISTWETEPDLAVILAHYKTDKVIKNILQFVLLKTMPHKLLFINNTTQNAFLIEKNSILKRYNLFEKIEVSKSDVFEY